MNVRHTLDDEARPSARGRDVARLLARPWLWHVALSAMVRFAPRGWWRRPPFLPVPDERYWRFRMETAYGDEDASPDFEDLVTAMRWAHRASRRRR